MLNTVTDIIWDLDNTLYKYDFGSRSHDDVWGECAARAARKNGLKMDLDKARTIALQSWYKYHDAFRIFDEQYGICAKKSYLDIHSFVDLDIIDVCPKTPGLLRQLQNKRHSILTYATKDWTNRVLPRTNLAEFFEPQLIVTVEDYDFEVKATSPRGILTALDRLALLSTPERALFVEDSLANLKPAKEQGVKTAYLHHGRPVNDNDMGFVNVTAKDTPDLIEKLKRSFTPSTAPPTGMPHIRKN